MFFNVYIENTYYKQICNKTQTALFAMFCHVYITLHFENKNIIINLATQII